MNKGQQTDGPWGARVVSTPDLACTVTDLIEALSQPPHPPPTPPIDRARREEYVGGVQVSEIHSEHDVLMPLFYLGNQATFFSATFFVSHLKSGKVAPAGTLNCQHNTQHNTPDTAHGTTHGINSTPTRSLSPRSGMPISVTRACTGSPNMHPPRISPRSTTFTWCPPTVHNVQKQKQLENIINTVVLDLLLIIYTINNIVIAVQMSLWLQIKI